MKMVVLFANKKALDLYRLDVKHCFAKYKIRIGQLIDAPDLKTIGKFNSLNLEKLKGDRKRQFLIRIDNQFRICFRQLNEREIQLEVLELTDYH
jgi:plasmid maintenance system killer protein